MTKNKTENAGTKKVNFDSTVESYQKTNEKINL